MTTKRTKSTRRTTTKRRVPTTRSPLRVVNYLFPGSFSPVSTSHALAFKKLIQHGETDYDVVRVFVIPVSDKYAKDSVRKLHPSEDYLSETDRFRFLQQVARDINRKRKSKVIVSQVDYDYGDKHGMNLPTNILATQYDTLIQESPGIHRGNSETFLILGADNAYLDMAGWKDPKTILENVKILVFGRGARETFADKKDKKIKKYYEGSSLVPDAKGQVTYGEVVEERNRLYGQHYDLDAAMNAAELLPLSLPEISSTLLRKLLRERELSEDEQAQIQKIVVDMRSNDMMMDDDLVALFSPVPKRALLAAYAK
jgi:nicotinic acid mononucleotide adenylyltransferase